MTDVPSFSESSRFPATKLFRTSNAAESPNVATLRTISMSPSMNAKKKPTYPMLSETTRLPSTPVSMTETVGDAADLDVAAPNFA